MNARSLNPLWLITAVVSTAVLYYLGSALEPLADWTGLLMWVAPLPMLLVAPRVRAITVVGASIVAWIAGAWSVYWYLFNSLEMPIPLIITTAVVTGALFAGCVALFRALVIRGHLLLAVLAAPAAWVSSEFFMALATHQIAGNWWSMAYTQTDYTAILQTVAIAGTAGVSYLLFAVPCAITALTMTRAPKARRALAAGTVAALLAASLTYGFIRPMPAERPVNAAALGYLPGMSSIPVDKPEAAKLTQKYRSQLSKLGEQGVSVVVLPEKVFLVSQDQREEVFGTWETIAAESGVNVVLGLELEEGDDVSNVAVWFDADDGAAATYRKQYMVMGMEDHLKPNSDLTFVPGNEGWAMAICKDFDYAELTARYRDADATIMFAPALDFGVDGWWHSRIAITRGVEQGMSVVRNGLLGRMTVSDPYGRVLADDEVQASAKVSTTGASTLYSKLGDWLVYLSLVLTVVSLVIAVKRRRGNASAEPNS